jgi:hypothetical protein
VQKAQIKEVLVKNGITTKEKIESTKTKKSLDFSTAEGMNRLVIRELNQTEISHISIEDTAKLMSQFCSLNWMLIHLEKYGETPEAVHELQSVVDTTIPTINQLQSLGDKIGRNLDRALIEKQREQFIQYLSGYLKFVIPRITKYLLPSSKWRNQGGQLVPEGLKNLLESYEKIIG